MSTAEVTTEIPNSPPMGGTELILGNLKKALPELTDKVQIICSRPEQVALDPNKPKILWLQDLPQDPASQCLRDAAYRSQFNKIVFVSHWQQAQYQLHLGIPFAEGTVIKNAVPHMSPQPKPTDGKLKFIYTSTPHRGLAILAAAAQKLAEERTDWELDVYSSLNIYGWHEMDKQFQPLYDRLNENPCVNYIGSRPNAEVREALQKAHVWVYPSVYQETSCMAAQEAMMSGCLAITTNYGALPETCGEWAWMFEVNENPEVMAHRTHIAMRRALDTYGNEMMNTVLEMQAAYFQQFYSFELRVPQWQDLLKHAIAMGPAEAKLVIDTAHV